MSLFENDQYRWRETYFVLFHEENRPTAESLKEALAELGDRYRVTEVQANEKGYIESLTLVSPYDFSAMDITYIDGEEVEGQVKELNQELKGAMLTDEERAKLHDLPRCNARFDVYHFEQVVDEEAEEEEFLDPGALLIVLERLARVCRGVGVDPQSGTVM